MGKKKEKMKTSPTDSTRSGQGEGKTYPRWPVIPLAGAAFVAIWGGWVDLGRMAGFGPVNLLPGIMDVTVDLAITLPLGMEVYAAYAMGAWLTSKPITESARGFAKWSAIASLVVGAVGQVAYHLMVALGIEQAPWQIVAVVACIPVAVLGMASNLAHRIHSGSQDEGASSSETADPPVDVEPPAPGPEEGDTLAEAPSPSPVLPVEKAATVSARMATTVTVPVSTSEGRPDAPTAPVVPVVTAGAMVRASAVHASPLAPPASSVPTSSVSVASEASASSSRSTDLRSWVIEQIGAGAQVTGQRAYDAGYAPSERTARRNIKALRDAEPEIFESSLHLVPTMKEMAI